MNWQEYREHLRQFAALDHSRRAQLLFRGHAKSSWPLLTTLDRSRPISSDREWQQFVSELLVEFRREAMLVRAGFGEIPLGDALELLARHHGLWSPILDWTTSPYIASYFALQNARGPEPACVWTLDRSRIPDAALSSGEIELIDDRSLLQFNRRALQQRAVFIKVNTVREPFESLLGPALSRVELDAAARKVALADLDSMNISASILFDDFDGVAQTVLDRIGN